MGTPASRYRWVRHILALLVALALTSGAAGALASTHAPSRVDQVVAAAGQTTLTLTVRADAGIESPQADTPLGGEPYLPVYYAGDNEYGRALLLFGLADLPSNAIVDSATPRMYLTYSGT